MPRYLLETDVVAIPLIDAAMRLASQRFPEIAVEDLYTDLDGARTLWVCRAPSKTHVGRWAEAAHLASASPGSITAVGCRPANDVPPSSPPELRRRR